MFNQNEGDKKLDWMYKGATSLVDREDYLLGRSIDRTLEQLNAEEKLKEQRGIAPPKNHVEHECIPPSIRDYKLQQELAEQVDLQAKLQEDPLLAIKKREEETRRQFLQNPVQLRKLQKALSKQNKKSKKKAKDLDDSILEKLKVLQGSSVNIDNNFVETTRRNDVKKSKRERDLDIILMHKFNAMKSKLTETDLMDIMNGKISDSEDSASTEEWVKGREVHKHKRALPKKVRHSPKKELESKRSAQSKKKKRKHIRSSISTETTDSDEGFQNRSRDHKAKSTDNKCRKRKTDSSCESSSESSNSTNDAKRARKMKFNKKKRYKKVDDSRHRNPSPAKTRKRYPSEEKVAQFRNRSNSRERHSKPQMLGAERPPANYSYQTNRYNSDDENETKIQHWGLVKPDGTKIPPTRRSRSKSMSRDKQAKKTKEVSAKVEATIGRCRPQKYKRMSSQEKEQVLKEMMRNAADRDVERARNIKKHREDEAREETEREFNPEFAKKEYLKSANSSTVESRIKANLNNIQRNKNDMNSNFSRRQ